MATAGGASTAGTRPATGHGRRTRDSALPSFSHDPYAWFSFIATGARRPTWRRTVDRVQPAIWIGPRGNAWRILRSTHGIEVRPDLVNPFMLVTDQPRVSAIAVGHELWIELSSRDRRWVDRFPLTSLDIETLGRAMLDEQELPHDNLPRLFPVRDSRP